MINVILADHQRVFRVGMACALASDEEIRIVGQPSTLEQLLRGIDMFRPQVVVMSSLYLDHLEAIKAVCSRSRSALMLVRDYGAPALAECHGDFAGVIDRSVDPEVFVALVKQILTGARVAAWSKAGASAMVGGFPVPRIRRRLTQHELQIVRYVVQGLKNREIAVLMGSTESTVKNALGKIFDKMGVFGRLELAISVVHSGILSKGQDVRPGPRALPEVSTLVRLREPWKNPTIQ